MGNRIEPINVVVIPCTVRGNPYLGLHVGTAGLRAEGGKVTKRLGLLLERHDAVLLEHGGGQGGEDRGHYPRQGSLFSVTVPLAGPAGGAMAVT